MKFEEACEKSMEYFKNNYNDYGFRSIRDLGESWLFDGESKDGVAIYGKPGITIDKKSGELKLFCLPNERNFELLDGAINIAVPEKYRTTD